MNFIITTETENSDMDIKVVKFGGSSLADAKQMQKVKNIIFADRSRRFVIPSAPGKRCKDDEKVTDMPVSYTHLRAHET